MTDEHFRQTYRITSIRGNVYGRDQVADACMKELRFMKNHFKRYWKVTRERVLAVLDDHTFMRLRAGEIPTRVAESVVDEAERRAGGTT